MDLPATILAVDTALCAAEASVGSYADDPRGYHTRWRAEAEKLSALLKRDIGAAVTNRYDGTRVRIAGITSTSTSGLVGALHNWLRAARSRETAA